MDLPALRTRILHALSILAVGVIGAWAALLLVGPLTYTVGPFEVSYFMRPGLGQTDVSLPPFGRLTVDTHTSPIRFTATLENADPDRITEAVRTTPLSTIAERVEDEAVEAIRTHALRTLGIGAAGGAAAGFLVYRRRWRTAVAAMLAGTFLLGSADALARVTYERDAFLEPRFEGSLQVAARLLGPIRGAGERIEAFRSEVARLSQAALAAYEGLATDTAPSPEALAVLHISDMHASPLGMDFAQQVGSSFRADLVIDTGDITSFGTALETTVLDRIPGFEVPYVFVRGNHDAVTVGAAVARHDNAIVLNGEATTIAGLTIYGAPHPLYTPDPGFELTDEEIAEAVRDAGEDLAEDLAGMAEPPDVLAVHDDRMAEAAAGMVPLVISGHFHQAQQTAAEGTVFLRTGSTGGGGLDTFTSEEKPVPLSAQILYFDGSPPELVAIDVVELDPVTRQLSVDRILAADLLDEEPVPAPSPS